MLLATGAARAIDPTTSSQIPNCHRRRRRSIHLTCSRCSGGSSSHCGNQAPNSSRTLSLKSGRKTRPVGQLSCRADAPEPTPQPSSNRTAAGSSNNATTRINHLMTSDRPHRSALLGSVPGQDWHQLPSVALQCPPSPLAGSRAPWLRRVRFCSRAFGRERIAAHADARAGPRRHSPVQFRGQPGSQERSHKYRHRGARPMTAPTRSIRRQHGGDAGRRLHPTLVQ